MIANVIALEKTKREFGSGILLKSGVEFRKCMTGAEYRRLLNFGCVPYDFYLVSTNKILNGDHFTDLLKVMKCKCNEDGRLGVDDGLPLSVDEYGHYKIEASTDTDIKIQTLPEEFVYKIIEFFNNNTIKSELLVEFDYKFVSGFLNYTRGNGQVGLDKCEFANIRIGSIKCGDCPEYRGHISPNSLNCAKAVKKLHFKLLENSVPKNILNDILKNNPEVKIEIKKLFYRYNEFIAHNDPDKWEEWINRNLDFGNK